MQNVKKFNIKEHIDLYYIEDDKYKTVSTSMYIKRPLSREEATKNALMASVMARGTQKFPSINDINKYLESLYGTIYGINIVKKSNVQSILISINSLSDKFACDDVLNKSIDTMLDFAFDPVTENGAFIKSYVDTEKKNLKDSIESLVNDKRSYANHRCFEEMCAGEKCGIFEYGYIDDIEKIDEKGLYDHYKSVINKSPIDIFIIGEVDIASVVNKFKQRLDEIDFNIEAFEITPEYTKVSEIKYIVDKFDVTQGKLALGLRTGATINDDMYYPLLVGNSILGAGPHSKLFNNVREKMSLAYYVSSRLDKFNPIMIINSGIEFENFEKAKNEILVQIDNVKNGNFTDDEFDISKEFIINSYKSYLDSPSLLRDFYLGHTVSKNNDTLNEAQEKIRVVTKEEVVEAFKAVTLDTVYFLSGKEGK